MNYISSITKSQITVMSNITNSRNFLKGKDITEGDRPTFEVLEATIANKQEQKADGTWGDATKTEPHYDRETKKYIDVTNTPVSYNLVMIDADESIKCPKVWHINMQSDTAVDKFEKVMQDKGLELNKDAPRGSSIDAAIGMEITFERISNIGFPPSVVPMV